MIFRSIKKIIRIFTFITLAFILGLIIYRWDLIVNNYTEREKSSKYFELIDRLECIHDSLMMHYASPGVAITVVKDTHNIFTKASGIKKVGEVSNVDLNTVFRLGSVSKGFASILAAKMIEEGYFNWDDLVVDYIPEFKLKDSLQSKRITIQHLLSHSTGLMKHAYTNLIEDNWKLKEIIPKLSEVNLYAKEGELFAYQNLTYALIQEVIKSKTDTTYEYWLESLLLKPLGMKNYSFTKDFHLKNDNNAYPHRRRTKSSYGAIRFNHKYYNAVAAGGLNLSISDMQKWLQFLLGNRNDILSDESLEKVFSPFIETTGVHGFDRWKGVSKSYYGLGWRILEYKGRKIIYHGGSVNDFRSLVVIDPLNDIAMSILFNANCQYANWAVPLFLKEVDRYSKLN